MAFPGTFVAAVPEGRITTGLTWGNASVGNTDPAPGPAAVPLQPPLYCPMLAVDIQAFNDHRRGEDAQRFIRTAMYALLMQAFHNAGLRWEDCHHEDRGDGVLVVAPPATPANALIDPLVDHVRAGLRMHNKFCNEVVRINLRMSAHAGQVYFDGNGVSGHAVTHLFRLLEASEFKHVLADSGCDFALVSSEALYNEVISNAPGLIDPGMYAPINLTCKETLARAWLYLPPVRNPFLQEIDGQDEVPCGAREREPEVARPRASSRTARPPGAGRTIPFPGSRRIAVPQQRAVPQSPPSHEEQPADDAAIARSPLIAAMAMTMRGWLASPVSGSVPARFRGRFDSSQSVQHA